MLLLLLFTYFAHNATQALTIPLECEYQSEALFPRLGDQYFDDRSVWSIVWSCLATLFACSWVAVHPNVPRATDSEALIFGRRLATMGYMLLAPELVIFWAAKQHFSAKNIEEKYQARDPEWTRTHAFFVIMGGFALHDADKSFLRVLDESTLEELAQTEEIDWPTITAKEIQDRSKADIFSKGIVLLQTTWFIVQCVSRFATKLAVTEVEVVTFAFAVLNAITYWLWWDKPSDVRCAVRVYLKSAEESSNKTISEARKQRDTSRSNTLTRPATKEDGFLKSFRSSFERRRNKQGLMALVLDTLLLTPVNTVFGPLLDMGQDETPIPDDDVTRVPTFYSPPADASILVMIGVAVLFGAIHFISWPSTFPTAAERWLWRVSTILITAGPFLMVFSTAIGETVDETETDTILMRILSISAFSMVGTLMVVYIISRIILLILPLILLRDLPPKALLELKWSEFFPHI